MRYLYNMENFLVVKVQASIRQQMIYRVMVEAEAQTLTLAATNLVPGPIAPSPIATSAYTPSTTNHASWLFDAYLSRVHSDR